MQTLCVYSKKEIFFKARWGRRLQKGSSWKSPASLGVTNVSFVLILVPDLWIILYFLELSAGVLGCCGTVTPILVNLVSPVFLWLHLPSFLSLWTFLVKRFLAYLLLRWLLFQGCTSQYSKHSPLSGAVCYCWWVLEAKSASTRLLGKNFTFHNVIVKDLQLLQALQVTFPRHKWDYNSWISLLEVCSVLQRFVGTISCSKFCVCSFEKT